MLIFALSWGLVFGQLVSGHDPALGSGRKSAGVVVRQPQPKPKPQQTEFVYDPVSGVYVPVPIDRGTDAPTQTYSPPPAPVTTRQS
jgi:hypothetical protein